MTAALGAGDEAGIVGGGAVLEGEPALHEVGLVGVDDEGVGGLSREHAVVAVIAEVEDAVDGHERLGWELPCRCPRRNPP